ncbi:MAG: TonB-dependent receptor plug domain-containing protein [Puia sp.]|nr:TonB-dependent receptor plug domain-containing protein [Puia sp.]
MKQTLAFILLLCTGISGIAQHTLSALIKDASTKAPLPDASVQVTGTAKGAKADNMGLVILSDMADGPRQITIHFVGYKDQDITLTFPRNNDTLTILLEQANAEMNTVVISSTRNNRTFQNIPTRVEFINGEELEEKGNMKPGDIRMMLGESTGIQTQQVSATSANSSIRIQGLDGRYTQILKDGLPLFAGFSGGLGLLQTPPLDLKQVEIIKGSSSTLYGGGAIAGLVNLISKTPKEERELRFLVNGTSAHGLDLNGFYGQRWGKVGLTLYGGRSSNAAYNPSGQIIFSAIPQFDRYVLNPRIFLYFNPATKLSFGVNTSFENRIGGDMQYLKGHGDSTHSYFERNKSQRLSTEFSFDHQFNQHSSLTIKNSVSNFNRAITIPGYTFDGKQWSSYTEIAGNTHQKNVEWVAGLNVYADDFKERPTDTFPKRSYRQNTIGGFIQNTWSVRPWLQTEAGLRGDYIINYGLALLPRISALFKITPRLTSRVGGGLGYKTPTIFTEETERVQYQSVLPISPDSNRLERSYGVNGDVNYRSRIGKLSFSVNQLFFYTRIDAPLVPDTLTGPVYRLTNHPGYLQSKGFETNVKLAYQDFKLYIGYTFTDAHLNENGVIRENPLTVRHRLNNVLIYEKEDQWKLGLEAYYFSTQPLNDGTTGKAYWTFGFMAEKIWKPFSLFINFENFTDTRQTRFDAIYTGTITHPVFRDIYAPLDGFVINGGLKLKL